MANDNKRKLYDALSQDYDMGSYEQFCADLNDEGKRRKLYNATSQDYDLGTWDSFSKQLGYGKAAKPASAPAAPSVEQPTVTKYYILRRGGKDFTVSTDEVNAAGGLSGWAKAHPGAPLRVYMLGTDEKGKAFDGHVDLSVAHDRFKKRGYKYATTDKAIGMPTTPHKTWQPSVQDKIRMSYQMDTMLNDFNQNSKERVAQFQRMTEPYTAEGRKKIASAKFQAQLAGAPTKVMGLTPPAPVPVSDDGGAQGADGEKAEDAKPSLWQEVKDAATSSAGAVGQSPVLYGVKYVDGRPVTQWLLPDGSVTTSLFEADQAEYVARTSRLDKKRRESIDEQIQQVEAELEELRKKADERGDAVVESYERENNSYFAQVAQGMQMMHGNTPFSGGPNRALIQDSEFKALTTAIRQREEQLKDLYEERDRQMGTDVGFWRGFGRVMGDSRTWDLGIGNMMDAITMVNADKYLSPNATEGEQQAGQAMMKAIYDAQQTEQMYGGNASWWNRAGVMAGYMPSFIRDFAFTGNGFEALNVAGKAAAKGAAKVIGKEAIEEIAKLGVKAYAKKYGVRGVGRMAGSWAIKALGTTADDLLIRAPLMTNTIQGASTAADIIGRKLGDVVVDENGNYDFTNDKTWGSAVWQGEANAIIENYSEMFGAHLDGVVPALAKTFGGKRISGMLARANASSYGKILATTRKQFQRLGVSDYFGEVGEEYYGQLWRTMLNLDDAYTNVPVLDKNGNQVLDAEGNPVYERKNLLFTGQFNGDIWGGMALSMGLMGAGKYTISGIAYGNMKHQVNKADKRAAEIFTPERWEPIRELIDNTANDDIGALAESMVIDQNLSDYERSAVMEYMERSLNLRGHNLGAMAQGRGTAEEEEVLPANIEVDGELSQSYIDGYEASSPQEMNDAQNMYEYQRQRAEGMFEPDMLDWFDSDPVNALMDMSQNGIFSQEEIDAARDYINAKTVRDGILQRVNDNIDEQIAQSDAMINGRINPATGMIQPVLMGLDDRQVYVVGGSLSVNPDGTIDRDASDESIVVRDAQTGELEFTDPKSIVSAGEAIDPEMEKAIAVDNIRQQAAQAAADAMNGTLAFNPGDNIQINDGGGAVQVTVVGPVLDEESGLPIEDQIVVQFPDGRQAAFAKEQLQAFADATNLERLNEFEQRRAAERAQQHATEAEAMRPQFALNDEFTIFNDTGTPIRGSITRELDEDGMVEVYTEEPINGNKVNRFTPAELEEMFDTYNGTPTTAVVPENVEPVPNPAETASEPQQSALSRIPVDEQGQPKYDDVYPDAAWDAIVEQAQGDEATAAEVVADIVAERQEDFNAAEKALAKTKEGKPEKRKKGDPAPTMAERIAAKNAAKAALAEDQAIRDKAKAALDHWKKIAGTKQRRESERLAAEATEARRRAQERAEEEARLKAEREEADRIEREALNGIPDWNVDTPADARARGYRRNGPQKVDRPVIIDNHALGNAVEVKFGENVMPKGNIAIIEASQLQPSHRDGQRNPAHFLDEAQPKERKDAASRFAAAKIAETMRPEEITSSVTAFTGAPSINARGEVIQGNNRSEALRLMYKQYSQSAERYKQYLLDHAAEFGLTPEAIAAFEQPILVNMLDVSDADAITLGQYVAQDTESGGIERIKPKNAVKKMGDKIRTFANLLLRSADDEATFAQLVDTNGLEVLKWMNQQGYITNTQYASAFDSKGNLSAEAANDLKGIMYQSIFTGGSTRLEEMFNKMPAKAQRAILATAFRDYDSPFADRMINEIQQSIIAFNALMGYEQFRNATNAETAQKAVAEWGKLYAFDDVSGESYLPSETFSNFALALAAMYKGNTQRHIQSVFNMMYDIVQGTEQDNLFEVADKTPKPLAEAIRRALNIEYKPIVKPTTDNGSNGSPVLDINSENGQDGRPGSDGNPDGAEQPEIEAEPSDSGTGAASDSGQRGELAKPSFMDAVKALYERGKEFASSLFQRKYFDVVETPDFMKALGLRGDKFTIRFGVISRHFGKDSDHNLPIEVWEQLPQALQKPFAITKHFERKGEKTAEKGYRIYTTLRHNDKYIIVGADVKIAGKGLEINAIETAFAITSPSELEEVIYTSNEITPDQQSLLDGRNSRQYTADKELSADKDSALSEDKQEDSAESSLGERVRAAEAEVNTTPTDAQKEAGNYKKGHVQVGTFDVTIEQPVGSLRRGKDADGKEWETTMQNTYGYIRGTEGVDGDHIDVFLSTDIDAWNGRRVVVVDQYNPDGTFDEHKVMLGFNDKADAINAYLANYEKGWEKGRRLVFSTVTIEDFEKWIESSHRKTKPFHEYKSVSVEADEDTSQKLTPEEEAEIAEATRMYGYKNAMRDTSLPFLSDKEIHDKIKDLEASIAENRAIGYMALVAQALGDEGRVRYLKELLERRKAEATTDSSEQTNTEAPRDYSEGVTLTDGRKVKGISVSRTGEVKPGGNPRDIFVYHGVNDRGYPVDFQEKDVPESEVTVPDTPSFGKYQSFWDSYQKAIANKQIPDVKRIKAELAKAKKRLKTLEQGAATGISSDADLERHENAVKDTTDAIRAYEAVLADIERRMADTQTEDNADGYTIDTYTTKKGKEYHRVVFPRADKEVWQERLNLAKKLGGTSVPKGYGFKTREEAEAFAKAVLNPDAVSDAQPLSLDDMRNVAGEDVEKKKSQEGQPASSDKGRQDLTTGSSVDSDAITSTKVTIIRSSAKHELNNLQWKYSDRSITRGFLSDLAKALGYRGEVKQSYYFDFVAEDGTPYTLRLSNHIVNTENIHDDISEISIVIKSRRKPNNFYPSEKNVVEYVYFKENIAQSQDNVLGLIVADIREMLDTGEYKDRSGIAVINRSPAENQEKHSVNPSGNRLVTDERYAELRERMRKKLGGQLNMGVDPEILAIGTEMAVYHIEKGARKFTEYAKAMIADLGDAIRPYLKSFYNAVRDLPEAEAAGLVDDMDSYEDVRRVDIANFDKSTVDAMATAEAVAREAEADKEKAEAEKKLKEKRKEKKSRPKPPEADSTPPKYSGEVTLKDGRKAVIIYVTRTGNIVPGYGSSPGILEYHGQTRDGKLVTFSEEDVLEEPAATVEPNLFGDSEQYQQREEQTAQLVSEIGGAIMERALADEAKPLTMTEVKKMAAEYPQLADISDTDLQELVELAMTKLTRAEAIGKVEGTAEQQRAAYDRIVSLYQAQPSLNARDSERLIKQQYSTPTPFGYVMGQFVRAGSKTVGSMLEPSAGNGALTIAINPSLIHVNDIDDARLANLRKLGFGQVTAQDALLPFTGGNVDVVMTNPPFGTVTEKVYDGVFRVSSLEGQMAINALEKMKDDGRAAIVIGGNTSYRTNGSMNHKDAAFFGYLYSHYYVADVINISGKALYSRNGTGYDVRMILIDGRKTGEFQRVYPPVKAKARAEQVTTFDELYKRVQDDIQQIQQMGSQSADEQRDPETAADGTASAPVRSGNNRPNTGAGQRPGTTGDAVRDTPRTDSGQPTPANDGGRPAGVDNADGGNGTGSNDVPRPNRTTPGQREQHNSGDDGRRGSGNDGRVSTSSRLDSGAERLAVSPGLTEEKVPYPNQSGNGFTLMSVVPAAQAQVLQRNLGEIGDVDQFLVDELGYSSKEELYSYLAAEQIDSVALAIHQMNKGNAFIIGDMTGVGKGRQGAALIRYAVKHGSVPVYFTQKPTLFTDNYRDLSDIGSSNLRPFIIASDDSEHTPYVKDSKGNVVYKLPTKKERERVYNYIMEHGTLPDEYDYVITTYDQIKNGNLDYRLTEDGWVSEPKKYAKGKSVTAADRAGQVRRDVLAELSNGNIVILDESHTVGGDSGSGRYMQMLTSQAEGVTFMSATFAKRADNMPIYAQRTAIAEAGVKASELIDAIMKGGVTLQEIMSKQLVESGQMIRRERSFDGVAIDWLSVEEETDRRQRQQFNEVAEIFNAIRNFQNDYIKPIIADMNDDAASTGGIVDVTRGTESMGVKNVPFASKMYNLVNQLLFALKVDAVADRVIENLRNGYKPVISFTNTMEGFLKEAEKGVPMDEVPNFSITLLRALDGVMRYTEKDADQNSEGGYIPLSKLSSEGQSAYNAIREKIIAMSADLPISPMDAIRMKIEEAGYSVAEITGRELQLNRTEDGQYIVETRKDRDKDGCVREFNSGKLDVLMINKSGSTGISLHASSKFEDQRQRVMVFAQFQSDINDEVQMRGRIDRSGQVTRGRYEYIMSTIPAEQRIQMMFKAKLKSLDANTTSSQKSKFNEMEIVDYLNKYGDEVVWEYMKEHPELEERLGDPLDMLQEKYSEDGPRTSEKEDTKKKPGCAGLISRYLAFLSVEEQDEIFREITEAYRVKIQLLDDAGENDLEITTMPLRAETKRKQIWHEGENAGSGNAFADNTYVEEVEVDVLKKPMKRDEIIEATRKLVGDKGIVTEYDQMRYGSKVGEVNWTRYAREKEAEISQFFQEKADEAVGKLRESGEARIAKAREKAVAAATKARGRGENNFTDAEIQSLADTVANEEREKEERKQDKRRSEIMGVKSRIQTLLNRLRAGSIYVVPQDLKQGTPEMFSQTFGTFVGFKFNKSYTLGSSTAIFATLDGRRKVELALSDPAIGTIISATEIAYRYSPKEINAITMENWDSNVPTQTRQKRYIITGNLLQALVDTEKGEKTRGNLISYSTIDGETRQGILMGENFKLTDLRNSASLSSRLAQIREGKAVISENGDVQIEKVSFGWQHRGQYELKVPKSKQRGGIYTMHTDLLKLVEGNNFITKGNNMVAYINEADIVKVVEMLSRAPFNLTVLEESALTDVYSAEAEDDVLYRAAMSRDRQDFDNIRERAVTELGMVMPGLNETEVIVTQAERHPFTGENPIAQARKWAKDNIAGVHTATDSRGVEFEYSISNSKIDKYLSESAIAKSENLGTHLSALIHLPEIISRSIEAEVHPDYNKSNGKRSVANEVTPDVLIHRFYGALEIEGKIHRVKTTIIESRDNKLPTMPHSFEVTKIELLPEESNSTMKPMVSRDNNAGVPYGAAKLLNGVEKSYDSGKKLLDESAKEDVMSRQGDGYGAYSDAEVSYLNDPVSRVWGKNRFSKKLQAEFAARERQRMANRIQELVDRMHLDNVEIVTDASQLEGKRATAKGFYNKRTGKITIVIPNNVSTIDAEQTLLHEAVAHYGLRQLFGEQFNTFLDNVYQSADEGIRRKITEMAAKNGWDFRTATEEYLAGLAEDTNFNEARDYGGWWSQIKRLFLDMLEKIGFEGFRDKVGVVLTDNELRYILWRSYENLAEPGRYRSILGEAADVVKQSKLKVGNYAELGIEAEYAAEPISVVNDSFNKQLERWINGQMRPEEVISLGHPKGVISYYLPNSPILLRQRVLSKSRKKHGLTGHEMKNLPDALANPVFVFKSNSETISVLTTLKSEKGENLFVAIELEKDLKFGGNTMVVNDILTIHGRETENVVLPIIHNDTLAWVDKGKGLEWLHSAKSKSQAITSQDLISATKVVKSFDNPTIEEEELFRPGDFSPRDRVFARYAYESMVRSGSYQFKEAVQDSMLGLKALYQAILGKKTRLEDVAGFENAYLFENRMSSMNAGEQHEYFQRYMQPLLKEIGRIAGADKRKRRELTDYLMAKHGLERNEYMRNEAAANGEDTDRDFAGLTGLTGEADWQSAEATAQQWVDDYESSVDTTALWQAINDATKATLEKIYLSGLLSKGTYEKILGMYQFYIPLRGWNETTSEQVYGYLTSKDGPLGGSIIKKAEGRESMADDPIATIGMMADDAIRQGNRNLMKQRFLNFILNHPSDAVSVHDIWLEYDDVNDEWRPVFADVEATDTSDEVAQKVEAFEQRMEALRNADPDKYKKGREAQHIPYKVVKGNLREHQILIKRNGRTFVATINGNPRAAQALNGLTNPDVDQNGVVGNMLKAGTWINRQLSAFYTTRNPDFVVSNFFRDALYSNCMTWVKESPRYARRFHKNFGRVNPVVMRRLLGKWEKGELNMSNRLEALFYQFMKNGGETGYTNVRDIEGHKRAVAAELKKQGSTGRRVWTALGMQLDLLNRSAENCARFAAGMNEADVRREVIEAGLGYENPLTHSMEAAHEYLSGNVREKMQQAEATIAGFLSQQTDDARAVLVENTH